MTIIKVIKECQSLACPDITGNSFVIFSSSQVHQPVDSKAAGNKSKIGLDRDLLRLCSPPPSSVGRTSDQTISYFIGVDETNCLPICGYIINFSIKNRYIFVTMRAKLLINGFIVTSVNPHYKIRLFDI